ncbi:MAG TPA: hypothetical protein VMS43_09110 [Allosphingosinicella sp.]|nr:hypothetical protein [Allosphingosinicella sp.]
MKRPLAFALLVLACGCENRPSDTAAPAPATKSAPAPPPTASGPDGAGPARPSRFIVCPGDRRCPRRKDGEPPAGAD